MSTDTKPYNGPSLGQAAYEAYCEHTGWKSLASGAQLPPWAQQRPEISAAWEAGAAAAVKLALRGMAPKDVEPGTYPDIEALIERVKARGDVLGIVYGHHTKDGKFTMTNGDMRGMGKLVAESIRDANRDFVEGKAVKP